MKTILVINPGSTSTKVAIYHAADSRNPIEVLTESVRHETTSPADELAVRTKAVGNSSSRRPAIPFLMLLQQEADLRGRLTPDPIK